MRKLFVLALFLIHASFAADFAQLQSHAAKTGVASESFVTLNDSVSATLSPSPSDAPIKVKNMLLVPLTNGELRAYNAFDLSLLWAKMLSGGSPVTPAYGKGVICIATRDGKVYGLDESGNQLFFLDTGAQITGAVTFANGKFYLGTGHPNDYLYEIDAQTGRITHQFFAGNPITGSPSTDGTKLYFGAGDGKLRAVDLSNFSLSFSVETKGTLYHITPAVDGGVVYFAGSDFDRNLYAVDSTSGAIQWQTDLIPAAGNIKVSSVAVSSSKVYIQAGELNQTASLFAVDKASGAISWSASLGTVSNTNTLPSPLLISDNPDMIAVAGTDGSLRVFDGSGNLLLTKTFSGKPMGALAAASGRLYLLTTTNIYTYTDNDTTNPTANLTSPTDGAKAGPSVTIIGTATDNHFVSYTLSYGQGNPPTYTDILTAYEEVDGGELGAWDTSALSEGSYILRLSVKDVAGNTSTTSVTIQLDHTPPSLLVTSPSDGFLTRQSTMTVSGKTDPGASVMINGASASVQPDGSFRQDVTLTEGTNTLTVSATDEVGNTNTVPLTGTLDTQPPALTVSYPSSDMETNHPSLTVTGTVEAGASLTIQGEAVTPAADGSFSKEIALSEGENQISVEATDAAGNKTKVSRTVILDTTPPSLSISSPSDGTITASETVSVAGTTEVGATVTVQGKEVAVDRQGAFSTTVTLTEGSNTIVVEAKDQVGNTTTKNLSVILDRENPLLQLTSPASNPFLTNSPSLSISGKSEPGASVTLNGQSLTLKQDGSFSTSVALSEGQNIFLFEAKDQAGNTTQLTLEVTLDTIPPELNLDSPQDGSWTNQASVEIKGTTEADASLTINGQSVTHNKIFVYTITLQEGKNTIAMVSEDRAGNKTEKSLTLYLDTIPPELSGLSFGSVTGFVAERNIQISGLASDEGSGLSTLYVSEEKSFNGAKTFTLTGSFSVSFTLSQGDGEKTVYLRASDRAGNFSSTERLTLTLDTQSYAQTTVDLTQESTELQTKDGTKVILGKIGIKQKPASSIYLVILNPLLQSRTLPDPKDKDLKATEVAREILFLDENGNPLKVDLLEPATLIFPYSSEAVENEDSLRIFSFDGEEYEMVESIQAVDKEAKTVKAETTHFSTFRLLQVLPSQNQLLAEVFVYPNPFSPFNLPTLSYRLKQDADRVEIKFYSASGKKLDDLLIFRGQKGSFIGRNRVKLSLPFFKTLPNGVYFYTISVVSVDGVKEQKVGKMVILR